MIRQTISIANGKGGVGKTSVAVNTAAMAASGGWRTLLVELDRQGNVAADLGLAATDAGRALFDSLVMGDPLTIPARDVRPGLDVIPGGEHTAKLETQISAARMTDPSVLTRLDTVLGEVAGDYDLIIIDTPPAGGVMVDLALAATRGVVIPVRHDAASLKGLELMARQFQTARANTNPDVVLLGVVMFGISQSSKAIRAEVRETLEAALGELAPVLDTVIRYSERGPYDMRLQGKLAYEYETSANEARSTRLSLLRRGNLDAAKTAGRYSQTASGLAEDYTNLANEIIGRLVEINGATQAAVTK